MSTSGHHPLRAIREGASFEAYLAVSEQDRYTNGTSAMRAGRTRFVERGGFPLEVLVNLVAEQGVALHQGRYGRLGPGAFLGEEVLARA